MRYAKSSREGSSNVFKLSGLKTCGVRSRLGTGKSNCFNTAGLRNGISDIKAPLDNHLNQITCHELSQVIHNLHDDYDRSFVYSVANV